MENEETDRKDLKIQALLEKLSQTVAQYENQIADYRVEITILSKQLEGVNAPKEEVSATN